MIPSDLQMKILKCTFQVSLPTYIIQKITGLHTYKDIIYLFSPSGLRGILQSGQPQKYCTKFYPLKLMRQPA